MILRKSYFAYLFLFIVIIFVSCDPVTSSQDEQSATKFLFLNGTDAALLDEQIKNYSITQEQIHYNFMNKIVGLSAEFNSKQLNRLNNDFSEHQLQSIPGEFIITFIDPFDGEKWMTEEGAQWSRDTIKEMQEKYGIDDNQIMNKYGYAIRGFSAKLNDEQLFGLDNDTLVKRISLNDSFSIGI